MFGLGRARGRHEHEVLELGVLGAGRVRVSTETKSGCSTIVVAGNTNSDGVTSARGSATSPGGRGLQRAARR